MKTFTIIVFLFSLIIFSFRFFNRNENQISTYQLPSPDSTFIIGVLESGAEGRFDRLVDSLGTNLWHRYPDGKYGWITVHNGWDKFDSLNAPFSVYGDRIKHVIEENQNAGMYTLMNRGKIQRLCFGQRSDYQCEESSMVDPDYWYYSFSNRDNTSRDSNKTGNDTIDNSKFGNGIKAVHCRDSCDQPGYVVKGLKANREQINCIESWGVKAVDENYKWFVKPRIRIDSAEAQILNRETPVCKIIVKNFNEISIKEVTLRIRHFLNSNQYSGKYMEVFNYENINDTQLVVDPLNFELFNPDCKNLWDSSCKVDFRVYWYGLCDMWIDYVRVDNEVANDIFKGVYEDSTFNQPWFKWEVQEIANRYPNGAYKFYIEEFEANQIPCMAYVNRVIDSLSNHKLSLMCDLNYSTFKIHIPGFDTVRMTADRIKRTLVDKIGSKEIMMGAYPFLSQGLEGEGLNSYIPNTLPVSTYHEPELTGAAVSVSQYENWLQGHLDTNRNTWFDATLYYKFANEISRLADIPFFNLIQLHSWFSSGHHLREPLNEEISLLSYLGLSYGAKGMLYFAMSGSDTLSDTICTLFYRGLGEPNSLCNYDHPRYVNAYGQEKWKAVSNLNNRIKKISPYLMSFDNTSRLSYIYRISSERDQMSTNTFISELKTYPHVEFAPYPIPDLDNLPIDTGSNVYLQAAFFNKPNDSEVNKYFMIVNRRCSPFVNDSTPDKVGGRRFVTLKINPSGLGGFNNWKIYDLETRDTTKTFDKNSTNFVYLGDFLPGEGKLYKLAPVMQEGGTLVADESFGGVDFNCKDTVISNGKNITITGATTTINFANSATIILTGANFYCGQFNTGQFITFKGIDNNKWNGLNLNNANVKIYNSTFQDIASPVVNYAIKMVDCPLGDIRDNEFIMNSDTAGGISSSYINVDASSFNLYINYNTFTMNNSRTNAIKVQGFSDITLPLYVQHNQMTSTVMRQE